MPHSSSPARVSRSAALFLALLLSATSARAQSSADASIRETPAEARFAHQGAELQAAGQYAEAIEAFRAAHQVAPRRRYDALIALNEAALDWWADGYRGLDAALRADDDPWLTRNDAMLRAELARLRQHVGMLDIGGIPSGARVRVDGTEVGTLPLTEGVPVAVGHLSEVELVAEGYASQRQSIVAYAGGTSVLRVQLTAHVGRREATAHANRRRTNPTIGLAVGTLVTSAALLAGGEVLTGANDADCSRDARGGQGCSGDALNAHPLLGLRDAGPEVGW